jgi:hypothetical protein
VIIHIAARCARQRYLKRWPGLLQNLTELRALLIRQPGVRVCLDGIEDCWQLHLCGSPPPCPDRRTGDRDSAGAALKDCQTPESGLTWIPHRRHTVQPLIVTDPQKYAEPAVAPQLDDVNVLLIHQRDPSGRTLARGRG